ncbi:ependymin-like, partial [Chanos chanos]|uniref:Ependymin-like n=1 Tax=Chanos chanos TaxID=29144 RepID=A0A6J2VQS0_CHACN
SLLLCLAAGCFAQTPQPCTAPPLLMGGFTTSSQNGEVMSTGKYTYDALGQKIRLFQFGQYKNHPFNQDLLLMFNQGVMYKINWLNFTCTSVPMKTDFPPLQIPQTASFLNQVVMGTSSILGQGLLVSNWVGEEPAGQAKYMSTVTEIGCIPVSMMYHTPKTGWIATSFFNNIVGIDDPGKLLPPPFCRFAKREETEPVNFFTLFA